MTPPDRPEPNGDPLAVILYRLQQIERHMDRMMTEELYIARHEALRARVSDLERAAEESARSIRQITVGLVISVGTAIITTGLTFT